MRERCWASNVSRTVWPHSARKSRGYGSASLVQVNFDAGSWPFRTWCRRPVLLQTPRRPRHSRAGTVSAGMFQKANFVLFLHRVPYWQKSHWVVAPRQTKELIAGQGQSRLEAGFSKTQGVPDRRQSEANRAENRAVRLPKATRAASAGERQGFPQMKREERGPPPSGKSWRARDQDEHGVASHTAATMPLVIQPRSRASTAARSTLWCGPWRISIWMAPVRWLSNQRLSLPEPEKTSRMIRLWPCFLERARAFAKVPASFRRTKPGVTAARAPRPCRRGSRAAGA